MRRLIFNGARRFRQRSRSEQVYADAAGICAYVRRCTGNTREEATSFYRSMVTKEFFFANKIHSFANFFRFFAKWVSCSPSGVSFSPTFLTTRAFFTPNRPHWIGPYPGCTNVPPRPPPSTRPARPQPPPPKTRPARPTRPRPNPPPSHPHA